MPKKVALLTILLILIFNVSVLAQNDDNINLKINDSLVTDDLTYKSAEDDILVPLQVLTNNLPIKMKWYNSIDTLKLEYKDKNLKFSLGGKRLQVNDELINFSAAPYKSGERFMVPLKVLGEALGLVIQADPEQGVVNIYQDHARIEGLENLGENEDGIKIKTDQEVNTESMLLQDPYRIVLDLKGSALYDNFSDFNVDSPLIKEVRIAQFDGNKVRVVLELDTKAKYKVEKNEVDSGYEYKIKLSSLITNLKVEDNKIKLNSTTSLPKADIDYLSDPQRAVIEIENTMIEDEKELKPDDSIFKRVKMSQHKTDPHIVKVVAELNEEIEFKAEKIDEGLIFKPIQAVLEDVKPGEKNSINIDLNQKVEPKKVFLESDSRIMMDFPATTTDLKSKKFKHDSQLIEEVRVSQFDQTTTRVVVDLVDPVSHQLTWDENQLQVNVFNKLTAVELKDIKAGTEARINLLSAENYKVSRLINPSRLVIDIPDIVVNENEVEVSDEQGVIEKVRVSQYSTNPHQGRVVLELNKSVNVVKDVVDNSLRFKLADFDLDDKVITLDPGHGGQDPGALGHSELYEKEPVLEIALKLEKLLEDAGAEVVMTRSTDEFIALEERVKLANKINSDIFVSIHLNGHHSSNSFGTETFIAPEGKKNSKLLGQFMQGSLVEQLGTFDRGVKEEELYVLEQANMPAVLEEVVFISNKEGEDKIKQEGFKDEAAVAMYKGIIKYFELLAEEEN